MTTVIRTERYYGEHFRRQNGQTLVLLTSGNKWWKGKRIKVRLLIPSLGDRADKDVI